MVQNKAAIEGEGSINLEEFYSGLRRADARMDAQDRRLEANRARIQTVDDDLTRFEQRATRILRQQGKRIATEAAVELGESLLADLPIEAQPVIRFAKTVARAAEFGPEAAAVAAVIAFVRETVGELKERFDQTEKAAAELRRTVLEHTRILGEVERTRRRLEAQDERRVRDIRFGDVRDVVLGERDKVIKERLFQALVVMGQSA